MQLSCKAEEFRVPVGSRVRLADWPTRIDPLYDSKGKYCALLDESREELSDLQNVLYAHDRYSVLLIFQGMDAAGKDGVIRHVMSGINPQGCQVFSFKQPSQEELDHDFLWRTNKRLPERGRIGIFNRSYYEDVLVVRVYPEILRKQRVPLEFVNPDKIWRERHKDIRNTEDYLHRNGTRIVKFFLHLSKEEQRQRFLARIDEPDKNWKLTPADIEVRQKWDTFMEAYEDCLGGTTTDVAPWHIVPADDKQNARLIVSHIVVEAMKSLKLHYPEPTDAHRKELLEVRTQLEGEGESGGASAKASKPKKQKKGKGKGKKSKKAKRS